MGKISDKLNEIKSELPENVCLVAVSKFHPISELKEAYDAGQRIFGESHVQELMVKAEALPKDIEWHFIGHLQTNKVKYIAPFIKLIHAVDTLKLLKEIDKQAKKCGRTIPCLLEMHLAQEESKYGFTAEALSEMLESEEWRELDNVRIVGLMCMATNTDDNDIIRKEFRHARNIFDSTKEQFFKNDDSFCHLSMGMSHDYPIAVEEGSTMVRVGSKLFGDRDYSVPFDVNS